MGKVYLVGAGPGDPELLTVRALRILRQADVVLYDRLVGAAVLQLVHPLAQRVDVGKQEGQEHPVQADILELMVRLAQEGRTVVRLKGGDPFVFGRGAEEWAALVERGVPVEVVPGLSSALALPALVGIPLTCRGVSAGFAVMTGRRERGSAQTPDPQPQAPEPPYPPTPGGPRRAACEPHWERYGTAETLVVLMGVKRRAEIARALIDLGRPPGEPVAFIERGCSPEQRVVEATLGEVARGAVEVVAPAVWVAGEAVTLRRRLLKVAPGSPPLPAAPG